MKKNEKTYIYTGSERFGKRKFLHQIIMCLWYGKEELQCAYDDNYIIEHHDNDEFNNQINNLSFAANNLNLAKAHTFDKSQPELVQFVAIKFFKDFSTRQYQITLGMTELFQLTIDDKKVLVDSVYLLYDDNFRIVFTDANRLVDELLESDGIDFKLLSYKKIHYREATFFHLSDEVSNQTGLKFIKGVDGSTFVIPLGDTKLTIEGKSPNQELYRKD